MTGRDRQTVADMAAEHCGNTESVFAIARHNSIAIDAEVAGVELADEPVADRKTQEYVAETGVSPAGMFEADEDILVTNDGEYQVVTENDETIVQ